MVAKRFQSARVQTSDCVNQFDHKFFTPSCEDARHLCLQSPLKIDRRLDVLIQGRDHTRNDAKNAILAITGACYTWRNKVQHNLWRGSDILVGMTHRMVMVSSFCKPSMAYHRCKHTPADRVLDLLDGIVGLEPEGVWHPLAPKPTHVCHPLNASKQKLPLIPSPCWSILWRQKQSTEIPMNHRTGDVQMWSEHFLVNAALWLPSMRPSR